MTFMSPPCKPYWCFKIIECTLWYYWAEHPRGPPEVPDLEAARQTVSVCVQISSIVFEKRRKIHWNLKGKQPFIDYN